MVGWDSTASAGDGPLAIVCGHWRTILLKDGSSSGEEANLSRLPCLSRAKPRDGFFVGFMSLQKLPYAGKQRQLSSLTGLSHETPRNHYPTDAAANYRGGIFSTCGINSLKRNYLTEGTSFKIMFFSASFYLLLCQTSQRQFFPPPQNS